jgi:hypothetical protein
MFVENNKLYLYVVVCLFITSNYIYNKQTSRDEQDAESQECIRKVGILQTGIPLSAPQTPVQYLFIKSVNTTT